MNSATITVIGGGSVNWMPKLMADVFQIDELEGGEIRLVDPNEEHTQAIVGMLHAFNRLRRKDYRIVVSPDRRRALERADFVMATFSPGAMDAFHNDLEIPIRYGIRQPVSMTVGPAGISASLRTAPVAHEIIDEMEAVCPDAWMLNVTNPMSVVTRAMSAAARRVKLLGLCHEFHSFRNVIGPIIGMPQPDGMDILTYLYRYLGEQGIEYTVAGVNHFIWLLRLSRDGVDLLPEVHRFAKENQEIAGRREAGAQPSPFDSTNAAKLALCRRFGVMPLAGDRHLVEFMPSLCSIQNGFAMQYGVHKTTVDFRRHRKDRQLANIRAIADGRVEPERRSSGEPMLEIMRSIVRGDSTVTIANAANTGQIEGMPEGAAVETLCDVTPGGVRPRPAGRLPEGLESLVRLHVDVHELTFKAAMEGSRSTLVRALTLDPLCGLADFEDIQKMADDLLEANRDWLPRFHGD